MRLQSLHISYNHLKSYTEPKPKKKSPVKKAQEPDQNEKKPAEEVHKTFDKVIDDIISMVGLIEKDRDTEVIGLGKEYLTGIKENYLNIKHKSVLGEKIK